MRLFVPLGKCPRSFALPLAGMLLALPLSERLLAQAPAPPTKAAEPQIQDNSFLIEEAYNQEPGVVQTIQTFTRVAGTGDWAYTLTQEWPVPDEKNQLSFTIPVQGLSGPIGIARGLGDVALNYRYQLVGNGAARVAISPRATLLVPTGDNRRALGSGGFGAQVDVPLSLVLSERFVAHTNLGATYVFSARNAAGDRSDLTSANSGQSVVWLAHPNFNVMLEATVTTTQLLGVGGALARHTDAIVSPGVRAAVNLPGHLQIVSGIAIPFGVGPSRGQRSLFLYFSVELPVFGEH